MATQDKVIVVTGATGRQGGAATRHLLRANRWTVRALTRNPASAAARRLAAEGAQVVAANLDDPKSLGAAMQGAYGVYSVQNFWDSGVAREIQQGQAVADAALAAGVQHFVYGSVGSAAKKSGVEHFESKFVVENYVRGLGLPATFVRPCCFMENYYIPQVEIALLKGKLLDPVRAEKPFQLIAVDDIGAFVALAFERPAQLVGQAIDLAGQQLTNIEAAGIFGRVMDRTITFKKIPPLVIRLFMRELRPMFTWFNDAGFNADVAAVRRQFPEVQWKGLEDWLWSEGWDRRAKAVRKAA
ncbi:MAG TPA: NmrA/HSCARG family protein [Polyangia bacterium]